MGKLAWPRRLHASGAMALLAGIVALRAVYPPAIGSEQRTPRPAVTAAPQVLFAATLSSTYAILDRGTSHIRGHLRFNATGRESPMLVRLMPDVQRIPIVGWGQVLDPEVLMVARPDAVVAWSSQATALRKIGVPGLVEISLGGKSQVEANLDLWTVLADLAGARARADHLTRRYQEAQTSITRQLLHAQPERAPRVLLVMGGYGHGYWLGGSRHRYNERLASAGGTVIQRTQAGNWTSSANGSTNLEQVLLLDPDIVFLESSGTGDLMMPHDLYSRADWQAVRAVRERRVYKMPDLPSFAVPLEDPIRLQWLFEVMHPELAPPQTREAVRATVRAVFDADIPDDDIDHILYLAENRQSQGYARFARNGGPS